MLGKMFQTERYIAYQNNTNANLFLKNGHHCTIISIEIMTNGIIILIPIYNIDSQTAVLLRE